jgi:hypothetical protein
MGKTLASKANRDGGAERLPEPAVQKRIAVALALSGSDAPWRNDLAWAIVKTAQQPDAPPATGGNPYPALARAWPWGCGMRCRMSTAFLGAKMSSRTAAGLKWACSAAAVLCFRDHLAGQKSLARLAQKHGQGKAWTLLAPQRARAVYSLRQRDTACELQKVLHGSGSGARSGGASGLTGASRDAPENSTLNV